MLDFDNENSGVITPLVLNLLCGSEPLMSSVSIATSSNETGYGFFNSAFNASINLRFSDDKPMVTRMHSGIL